MHCPRCGEQQNSDKIRFCRKCGFALTDVKELLVPEAQELKEKRSKVGKGVAQGLALILFGFVLISILAILRDLSIVPQVYVKIAAAVFCVGGLVRMCIPFLFSENLLGGNNNTASLQYDAATHTLINTEPQNNSLPPAESIPIINFGERSLATSELKQPPSVTEYTTKLLKNQPEQK